MRGRLRVSVALVAATGLLIGAALSVSGGWLLGVAPVAAVLLQRSRRAVAEGSGASARRALAAVALALPLALLLALLGAPVLGTLAVAALLVGGDGLLLGLPGGEPPSLPGLGSSLGLRGRLGLAADELALGFALGPSRPAAGRGPTGFLGATSSMRGSGGPASPEPGPGAQAVPALEKVVATPLLRHGHRRVEALRFESEYEPGEPEIREAWRALPGNRSGQFRLHRDPARPRPVLIALHDLGGGHPALDLHRDGLARLCEALDLDLALMVLPLHGERGEGLRAGEGWLDGSPAWCAAALGQSVHELQRVADWLHRQGAPAVGLHGRGLGGGVAAVAASLPLGLASLVLREPVVSFPDLRARLTSGPASEADAAGAAELRQRLAAFDPLSLPLALPPRAALVTAARADQLAPAEAARALAHRWGAALHGLPGGHWLPLGGVELSDRVADHLRGSLLAPEPGGPRLLTRFRRRGGPDGATLSASRAGPPEGPR